MLPKAPKLVAAAAALGLACAPLESGDGRLQAVEPGLVCLAESPATLQLRGSALGVELSGTLTEDPDVVPPSLSFHPTGGVGAADPALDERVVHLAAEDLDWRSDAQVEVEVDGSEGLGPGSWALRVTQADGSHARLDPALTVAGPPVLTGTDTLGVCPGGELAEVRLAGEGFIQTGGALPTAMLGDRSATVLGLEDCQDLAAPAEGTVCRTLVLEADVTGLEPQELPLSVTNPDPVACSSVEPAKLRVTAPPTLESVDFDRICASGGEVVVRGTGFVDGMEATLGEVGLDAVTVLDGETLVLTVAEGAPVGTWDLTVSAPGGCGAELEEALTVVEAPLVFSIEPPVMLAGLEVELLVRVADVVGAVEDAWLISPEGERLDVVWAWEAERPSELALVVPEDTPGGTYEIGLMQDGQCAAGPGATLDLVGVGELDLALAEVEPAFAWTFDRTPVTVRVADPLAADELGFEDVPRLFALGPQGERAITPLLGVGYQDAGQVNATIPDGLEPGRYDLFAVNPDGTGGYLKSAFTVTWEGPPEVTGVSPGTLSNQGSQGLSIRGRHFRDPTVILHCTEDGSTTELTAVTDSSSSTRLELTVSNTGFNQAVCVLEVVNEDNTSVRWAALSITNPAQNLFPWNDGEEMVEARRGPAALSARTSSVSRYVFAIGGDDGTAAGARSSVEAARVETTGQVGPWALLEGALPEPRTLAAAVQIGRFLYVVGGHNGADAVATTLRAEVLDPLSVPWFDDLSVSAQAEGLGPGTWTYRVSALFDASDAANPGGESLAGDPVVLVLPDLDRLFVPTIRWTPVDGAVAYRVYRSPSADAGTGSEAWLADVDDGSTEWTDPGDPVDPTLSPLDEGALGNWATLPALSIERESPCLAVVPDPFPDPNRVYLYAAGGKAADGTVLDSLEFLDITIESASVQTAGSWSDAGLALSEARYRCGAWGIDPDSHSVVDDGESWVLFGGGETGSKTSRKVDAGRVGEGGALEDWQTVSQMSPARSGFAAADASNFLYAFGGQNGGPSTGGVSGQLSAADLPDPNNWNSLGTSLSEGRHLAGSAQESAVLFVLGGETDSEAASRSTEWTNY